MECRNCPYGQEDFEQIKGYNPDYLDEEVIGYIWCDKVGGKISWYGTCNGCSIENKIQKQHSKKKRRNKRERDSKYKAHLKHLAEDTSGYPTSAYYVDKLWIKGLGYVENPKPYYKRIYRGQRSKYIKKLSNRKIRNYEGDLSNGWMCHKLYDFWYELY